MSGSKIRVAILEDHQGVIDGYMYRLSQAANMDVVGNVMKGNDLEPFLNSHPVDVLILDINVPVSTDNRNPFPILHAIPVLLKKYLGIHILAISVNTQPALIEALMNVGVRGYIYKDDTSSIQKLAQIVDLIAGGGTYFSDGIFQKLRGRYHLTKLGQAR
jgi:two-component system nitrate/nitrite response regulator NarL